MAKTWADITADQEFQGLPAADQETVREAFWQRRVAPNLPEGADVEQARAYFDQRTRIRKQDLPDGVTPSDAGAGRGLAARGMPTLGERMQQSFSLADAQAPGQRRRGGLPSEFKPYVGEGVEADRFRGASGDTYASGSRRNDGGLTLASAGTPEDPMLRQSFVDKERQDYQSVPLEYRRDALLENAKRNDAIGRAARVLLSRMPQEDMAGQMGEGRKAVPLPQDAGGSKSPPPQTVTFPDTRPTVPEMAEGIDARTAVGRREAGLQTSLQETGPDAMRDRDYRASGAMATEAVRKQMAKDAPYLSAFTSGLASGVGGLLNAPAVAADYLNQLTVNPVARVFGAEGFARVPNMPGADYFTQAADQYLPDQAKKGMSESWDDGKFIPWLTMNMAAQAPQMAQQVVAAMVPPLRAVILPAMGVQQAGQSYQQGDSSAAAISKGAIETASELLPFHVFDKVKEAILKIPPSARGAVVTEAMKRLAATGAAITASTLAEALEEGASQIGQNLVDIHMQGQNKSVMDKVADNMVVGGAMGHTMSLPHAHSIMRGDHTAERQTADAINDAAANYYRPAPEATTPTAARADSLKRFDEAAAAWGLSPKAAGAVREQAGSMPSDDVPGFLARVTAAFAKRGLFRRPVDEKGLQDLDKRLRPPTDEPAKPESTDVNQPDVAATAGAPAGAGDAGGPAAARSGGTVGPVPDAQRGMDRAAGAPEAGGDASQPVPDGAGGDAPALKSKRTPEQAMALMEQQAKDDGQRIPDQPAFEDSASDDILSEKGKPWASKTLANRRLRDLPNGYRLARTAKGWVIKPENIADQQPAAAAATTAEVPNEDAQGTQERVPQDGESGAQARATDGAQEGNRAPDADVPGDAQEQAQQGAVTQAADPANQVPIKQQPVVAPEVSAATPQENQEPVKYATGSTVTLDGKRYTVAKTGKASVTLQGEDGKKRTVQVSGATYAKIQAAETRTLNEDGRASDGKPINPGEVFRTASGRETTAYPKQKAEKYASQWLIDNAVAEAQARGDDFNATGFSGEKPQRGGELAPASRDLMLMYLFGEQPKPAPSILKPLVQKPAPAPQPEAKAKAEPSPKPSEKPSPKPSENTIVSDDAAERARALLRKKLGNINSGLDPEVLQAGITLAAYHVERGARKFAAYAKAMVDDLGDIVKPYLQSWYMATRSDPAYAALRDGMDKASAVEDLTAAEIDAMVAPQAEAAPESQPKPETEAAPQAEASQPERADAPEQAATPAEPAPEPAPAPPPARRAPKSFRKKVQVTTQVYVEESAQFEPREVDAETALNAIADDIKQLKAFRACIAKG